MRELVRDGDICVPVAVQIVNENAMRPRSGRQVHLVVEGSARSAEEHRDGTRMKVSDHEVRYIVLADVGRYDERVTAWWLHQRRAAGYDDDHTPESILAGMRGHIHPLDAVREALAPHFELGEPVRGPYLHRWHLPPGLREAEERLIGEGRLPATGARLVGVRRG